MANDAESVDSNGNSSDLRPRRSNRAKGKQSASQVEETDDNIVVNNVAYKVGDFVFYLDKKQDIFRIGLIEELKFQKRDKLSNKKAEITIKQFYRLDEIPASVLSNQGEYDTHVMPHNFPDWLRQREIFISDNNLSTSASSLRGQCTVRHFPDLNHAMVLFSASGQQPQNISGAGGDSQQQQGRHSLHHHPALDRDSIGLNSSLPVPKHRDDNTFFYVFSYNPRGRKLAVTYLEIRVGSSYQAELPDPKPPAPGTDRNLDRNLEQLLWKPGQIPEEVFDVYNMATISIACFSGFGGGVDDNASIENGRKIASHMLTKQRALDCLHKSQYNMEKAVEIFAENSLPETNKMPFLWTDEDHTLFDESVKIHGKNFLRIKQDKRNKKSRVVGDFVTFYYFWKKNRPKNRKYAAKKMLRSRIPNSSTELHTGGQGGVAVTGSTAESAAENGKEDGSDKTGGGAGESGGMEGAGGSGETPMAAVVLEQCLNCKIGLAHMEEERAAALSDKLRALCDKCANYLRRYGYSRPVDGDGRGGPGDGRGGGKKKKTSELDDEDLDKDGLDDMEDMEEDMDEMEEDMEDMEEDEVFQASSPPPEPVTAPGKDGSDSKEEPAGTSKPSNQLAAINKYDFDQEDENVEEVSRLLERSQATKKRAAEAYGGTVSSNSSKTKAGVAAGGSSSGGGKRSVNKRPASAAPETSIPIKRRRGDQVDPKVPHKPLHATDSDKKPGHHKRHSSNQPPNIAATDAPHFDSNTSNSTSSSSSNDSSSSSSDEADSLPTSKRMAGPAHKFTSDTAVVIKDQKPDLIKQEMLVSEPSYNQMITAVPNIPGVCAVTEPLSQTEQQTPPQQHRRTPLSTVTTPLSAVPATACSTPYPDILTGSTAAQCVAGDTPGPRCSQSMLPLPPSMPALSSGVGPGDSNGCTDDNMVLNLAKKPARAGPPLPGPPHSPASAAGQYWSPRHESPSKLMHYRGAGIGMTGDLRPGSSSGIDPSADKEPIRMVAGFEVAHQSMFGHLLRTVRQPEGGSCSRVDLQHWRSELTPGDTDKRSLFYARCREDVARDPHLLSAFMASQASGGGSKQMPPPPAEKQLSKSGQQQLPQQQQVVYGQTGQQRGKPPTSSPSRPSTTAISPAAISRPGTAVRTPHMLQQQQQPPPSQLQQQSQPPQHLLQSVVNNPLLMFSSQTSPIPAASSPAANQALPDLHFLDPRIMHELASMLVYQWTVTRMASGLVTSQADFTNMNKVANDLIIYQAMQMQQEELQKQELQKQEYHKLMMMNLAPPLHQQHHQQQQHQQQQQQAAAVAALMRGPNMWDAAAGVAGGGRSDRYLGPQQPQQVPGAHENWLARAVLAAATPAAAAASVQQQQQEEQQNAAAIHRAISMGGLQQQMQMGGVRPRSVESSNPGPGGGGGAGSGGTRDSEIAAAVLAATNSGGGGDHDTMLLMQQFIRAVIDQQQNSQFMNLMAAAAAASSSQQQQQAASSSGQSSKFVPPPPPPPPQFVQQAPHALSQLHQQQLAAAHHSQQHKPGPPVTTAPTANMLPQAYNEIFHHMLHQPFAAPTQSQQQPQQSQQQSQQQRRQ